MSNQPWFRLYVEFASDPVIQSLAFEDQRHYVVILCLKGAGVLDRNIDARSRNRIVLRALGLDTPTAEEAKRRLMEIGLIDRSWQPKGWSARQFQSDNSTPRVRNYRKRKKDGNGNATVPDSSGNGPDTETEAETDPRASSAGDLDSVHAETGYARAAGPAPEGAPGSRPSGGNGSDPPDVRRRDTEWHPDDDEKAREAKIGAVQCLEMWAHRGKPPPGNCSAIEKQAGETYEHVKLRLGLIREPGSDDDMGDSA